MCIFYFNKTALKVVNFSMTKSLHYRQTLSFILEKKVNIRKKYCIAY